MNIRDECSVDESCIYCKFFYSYHDKCEDELEPSEFGNCTHPLNVEKDKVVGENNTCDLRIDIRDKIKSARRNI